MPTQLPTLPVNNMELTTNNEEESSDKKSNETQLPKIPYRNQDLSFYVFKLSACVHTYTLLFHFLLTNKGHILANSNWSSPLLSRSQEHNLSWVCLVLPLCVLVSVWPFGLGVSRWGPIKCHNTVVLYFCFCSPINCNVEQQHVLDSCFLWL